jgi:hypothetical protein
MAEIVPYWIAQLVGGSSPPSWCGDLVGGLPPTRSPPLPARASRTGRARADRDRALRHRDLHRRDRRPCTVERRHGAAADRALHLHGRDQPASGGSFTPVRSLDPLSTTASSARRRSRRGPTTGAGCARGATRRGERRGSTPGRRRGIRGRTGRAWPHAWHRPGSGRAASPVRRGDHLGLPSFV